MGVSGEEWPNSPLGKIAAYMRQRFTIAANDHIATCNLLWVYCISVGKRVTTPNRQCIVLLKYDILGAGLSVENADNCVDTATVEFWPKFAHPSLDDFQRLTLGSAC